jgi:glucan 1,3-beta-glucosidase
MELGIHVEKYRNDKCQSRLQYVPSQASKEWRSQTEHGGKFESRGCKNVWINRLISQSVVIIDSKFTDVAKVMTTVHYPGYSPSIVLDNLIVEGRTDSVVSDIDGRVFFSGGAQKIESWAMGRRYDWENQKGRRVNGRLTPPRKDKSLLFGNDWKWFEREKPQYAGLDAGQFLNVLDFGVRNDGVLDPKSTKGINEALERSANEKKILVFPAGVYKVEDTLFVPPGARMVGVLWPQIMATGNNFNDASSPRIMMK